MAWFSLFLVQANSRHSSRQCVVAISIFDVYIDDLTIDFVKKSVRCTYNFVFADDILLLAPSLAALQKLVSLCEFKLQLLDLAINIKQSCYTRIGPRFFRAFNAMVDQIQKR